MWHDIKKLIQQNSRFIITTHVNPDGDGIGAACALTEFLLQLGKNVRFVCESPIPSKFAFLDYHQTHEIYDSKENYLDAQVLIVLDTHKRERIGRVAELLNNPQLITACIDHHTPTELFTPLTVIDSDACCVGAMIYAFFKACRMSLNLRAATGVYSSIICDTGRFSYASTTSQAHKIAEECIKMGVDPDLMHARLFQHVSLAEIKMFANALQHMETYLDNRVVVQQIFRRDYQYLGPESVDVEHIDLEYIHDFNKLIEDVECVMLLRELPNGQVRVSMRSLSDLNIGDVMRSLGGGGHSKAAGVMWKGSLQEIKEKILYLLEKQLHVKNIAFCGKT
jgi:phosphoesterase RecJ-like protein